MSFFVVITFDLNGASSSAYDKIHKSLEEIDFSKYIEGKRKYNRKLPGNTFAAEFESSDFDDDSKSSDVADYVKSEVKEIFEDIGVVGRYFVFCGKRWAWKLGAVNLIDNF